MARLACSCCHGPLTRRAALGMALGTAGAVLAGCEGAGIGELGASLVSPEEARQLGDAAFKEIRSETPAARDPALQARVERIGRRIVAVSESEIPAEEWSFIVFEGDEINAFALPGGHVGVYRGMFNVAGTDDELATVIAHEIGHVNARHAAQRIGTTQLTNLGVTAAAAALQLGGVQGGDQIAGLLGVGAQYGVILPFSRGQELEADRLGLDYMARAGYDPSAALGFWQEMMRASGRAGGPNFLSTHPSDEQRISQIEELLPETQRIYRSRRG